jgi:hypothetical protein
LRLTVDAFPDILEVLEKTYGYVIPGLEGASYED